MTNKDTCPMLPVIEKEGITIGVIGGKPGVGVSFICSLLERELKIKESGSLKNEKEDFRIIDLGECKAEGEWFDTERLIIVVDGSCPPEDKLYTELKIMKDHGKLWAVVFNKCDNEFNIPQEALEKMPGVPIFRIPYISAERFTELYNFLFYS